MQKALPKIKSTQLVLSGDKYFFSVQGEGHSIGIPAVFIRLHFCPLRCKFCDTKYAVFPEDPRYFTEPSAESIDDVIKAISKYPCKRLVITGGEPLLQKVAIDNLMKKLPDWFFEIETSGVISPSDYMCERGVQFNVSPKLANSGNPKNVRYRSDVLKRFNENHAWFKFVVVEPEDLKEIKQIVTECELAQDRVIIMPEGITQEAIEKHGRAVVDLVQTYGWRLLPRLHVMLFGNERKK